METATNQAERPPSRGRRLASKILLVVFCLSSVLTLVAGWARIQIENTDRYVNMVSPLASDPNIQQALIDRVTNSLSEQLDERVTIDLIEESALAAPIALAIEEYIRETVTGFVTSDAFPPLWERINRASHPLVTAVLTGSGTESISTDQGQITLDLAPLMTEVINRLGERGVDIVDRIQVDQLDTTFVIYESEDLASAQEAVGLLERLAVVFPFVALVSLGGAVAVSTNRRSTVTWAGLGLAAAMSLFLILLAFLRWWVVDNLPPDANREAATVFFETLGRYLRDAARVATLVGLVTAGVAYFTRAPVRVSHEGLPAEGAFQATWRPSDARWPGFAGVGLWSDSHRTAIATAIWVAACLLVVLRDPLDAERAMWILILTAAGYAYLTLIHAWTPATALAPAPAATLPAAMTPAAELDAIPVMSVERVGADQVAAVDGSRAELIKLVGELSADDLRILSRVAGMLRNTR